MGVAAGRGLFSLQDSCMTSNQDVIATPILTASTCMANQHKMAYSLRIIYM